ncbi:MAG: sugar ABC transporter permease [Firmicutes bacterium]|nr:sugar ABC transporter permease [Bacillota bacterium]
MLSYEQQRRLWSIIFVIPAVAFFGIFYVWPIIQTFWLSLHQWNIVSVPKYIGLSNYQNLFTSSQFINSFQVTTKYVFGSVIPVWIIALAVAVLFNREFRGKDMYIMLYYLPFVVSLTVWCVLWKIIYHPSFGVLTAVTDLFGFRNIRWLNDPRLVLAALIIPNIWKVMPANMVILLAGLGSIPKEYTEAAKIDGANSLRVFWHIILPLLKPVLLYVVIISTISAFQVFTPAYLMTRGGPGSATRVLPLFIYENGFQYLRMGLACAASMVLFMVLMAFSLLQLRFFGFGKEG